MVEVWGGGSAGLTSSPATPRRSYGCPGHAGGRGGSGPQEGGLAGSPRRFCHRQTLWRHGSTGNRHLGRVVLFPPRRFSFISASVLKLLRKQRGISSAFCEGWTPPGTFNWDFSRLRGVRPRLLTAWGRSLPGALFTPGQHLPLTNEQCHPAVSRCTFLQKSRGEREKRWWWATVQSRGLKTVCFSAEPGRGGEDLQLRVGELGLPGEGRAGSGSPGRREPPVPLIACMWLRPEQPRSEPWQIP